MPYIKLGMLTDFLVSVPQSNRTQAEVVAHLDTVSASSERLEAIYQEKLSALNDLKKSLLDRAFRGEL